MFIKSSDIRYVPHVAIDKQQWDLCVRDAKNSLIYAESAYLDMICPGWDALIAGNYEVIMPLPWKKKYGIRYLYQPFAFAQGGLFYKENCTAQMVQFFIKKAMFHFSYGTIDLNESNQITSIENASIKMRDNYVLNLWEPYEINFSAFNKDAKKNLRQANAFEQQITYQVPVSIVIEMYKTQYGLLNKAAKRDYEKLLLLVENFVANDKAFTIGVETGNELTASAIFFKDAHRLYYVLGAPSARGKECKSMHLLIDHVIKTFSNGKYELDFEGSDIPSVATFYKKFAPANRQYAQVHFNRLPFLLKWLKP
jgi:hypothetical protein